MLFTIVIDDSFLYLNYISEINLDLNLLRHSPFFKDQKNVW